MRRRILSEHSVYALLFYSNDSTDVYTYFSFFLLTLTNIKFVVFYIRNDIYSAGDTFAL